MSASAIPGATTARLVDPGRADTFEGVHDAPDCAEQPDERRDARRRCQKGHAPLQLRHLDVRGPQERAVQGIEALQPAPRDRAVRHIGTVRNVSLAQLRVQLHVAGLKDAGQRAARQRPADGVHVRELAAASEHVAESRRLALDAPELSKLEENDGPGCDGEQNEDDKNDLREQRGTPDQFEHPTTQPPPTRSCQSFGGGQTCNDQEHAPNPPQSDAGAPLGQRNFVKVARPQEPVKRMIGWSFHRFGTILATVSPLPADCANDSVSQRQESRDRRAHRRGAGGRPDRAHR